MINARSRSIYAEIMLTFCGILIVPTILRFLIGGGVAIIALWSIVFGIAGYSKGHRFEQLNLEGAPTVALTGWFLNTSLVNEVAQHPWVIILPFAGGIASYQLCKWYGNREYIAGRVIAQLTGGYSPYPKFMRREYVDLYGPSDVYKEDHWTALQNMLNQHRAWVNTNAKGVK